MLIAMLVTLLIETSNAYIDVNKNASRIKSASACMNISVGCLIFLLEANIVDPDHIAPIVWSRPTLFVFETSNILMDDKNIHFVIMRFKGK